MTLRAEIERRLDEHVDPQLFEQCVWDLLLPVYPGLAAIPGGSDFGRDGDVQSAAETARLIVTTAQDVKRNVERSIKRLIESGLDPHSVVVATVQPLSARRMEAIRSAAGSLGVSRIDFFERDSWIANLYHNAEWRRRLLGIDDPYSTIVDRPVELDLGGGRQIPLVGRQEQLESILRAPGADMVVVGVPGAGKTRLLAELPNVGFAIGHDLPRIADDILTQGPAWVVIDDAHTRLEVLAGVLHIRSATNLVFGVLAPTWPSEAVAVRARLPEATRVDVPLLGRDQIDEIVQSVGVTNYYLRREILDQSEGRPGWAVALARLAREGKVQSLTDRSALGDEVERYLAKAGLRAVVATLATIAALRAVSQNELSGLRNYLGVGSTEFDDYLERVVRAGLVDVQGTSVEVRPRPLAQALVSRWFFDGPIPREIDELAMSFPTHISDIQMSAAESALSGSPGAQAYLRGLMATNSVELRILPTLALMDEAAAGWAVTNLGHSPERVQAEVLRTTATRYALPAAVIQLLELGASDDRPRHSNPDHPLRVLSEVGNRIFPGEVTSFELRDRLLTTAERWAKEQATPSAWRAFTEVAASILSPNIEGHWVDAASINTVVMTAGFETPSNLEVIDKAYWPRVERLLPMMPDLAVGELVEALDAWLRLARGIAGPFGVRPSDEAQGIARRVSRRLTRSFVHRATERPGLGARLEGLGHLLGPRMRVAYDKEFRLLVRDVIGEDWPRRQAIHQRQLRSLAASWLVEGPATVIPRLGRWRSEATIARRDVTGAVGYALAQLATEPGVDRWATWIVEEGLCPEGGAILAEALTAETGPAWLIEALNGPCRATITDIILRRGLTRFGDQVLGALRPEDMQLVEWAVRMSSEPSDLFRTLLRHPLPEIRAATALGFKVAGKPHGPELPEEWASDWVDAFLAVNPRDNLGMREYEFVETMKGLIDSQPAVAEAWVAHALFGDADNGALRRLPFDANEYLPGLPRDSRDRLLRSSPPSLGRRYLLEALLGTDADWARILLRDEVISPEELLHAISGRTGGPLEPFIPVLIEVGVQPIDIARVAQFNSPHWGPASVYFAKLRDYFAGLRNSADSSLSAVGAAGEQLFRDAAERAESEERLERVRG